MSPRAWCGALVAVVAIALAQMLYSGAVVLAASSATSVVTATVPVVLSIGIDDCSSPAVLAFPSLGPGDMQRTAADCIIDFGANGAATSLRLVQSDRAGVAMDGGATSPPVSNLITYFPMEPGGKDVSPTANDAVPAASPNDPSFQIVDPGFGLYGAVFDGDDVMAAPATPVYAIDAFTIEMFVRTRVPVPAWYTGLAGIDVDNSNEMFQIGLTSSGRVWSDISASHGGVTDITSSAKVDDGEWHHIALTVDAIPIGPTKQELLYVDGILVGTRNFSGILDHPNVPLVIGNIGQAGYAGFDGYIDEVRMHSRVLDAQEIHRRSLARLNPGVIHDYGAGGDWSPNQRAFGACMVSAAGTGIDPVWASDGACAQVDSSNWNPIAATDLDPTAVLANLPSGAPDGEVHLRFGINTARNQEPGTYRANFDFDVIAPGV